MAAKLSELWHTLTAPRATNEDEARRQYFVNVILAGMGAIDLAYTMATALAYSIVPGMPKLPLLVGVATVPLALVGLWFSRRGWWRLAASVPLAVVWSICLFGQYHYGVYDVAIILYASGVIIAGAVYGSRVAMATAVLSVLSFATVGYLQSQALLPAPAFAELAPRAITVAAGLGIIVLLQWLFTSQLQQALRKSRALAEELRLHSRQLEYLVAARTAAQEEERQRIARELHDGVGPALASVSLRVRTASRFLQTNPAAWQEFKELADLTQANIEDIRRLIYDLRPAALDELGLVAALKEYVERYQQEQGLSVKLSLPEGKARLPASLETALFRIIQEGLTNAARHAKAKLVHVALDWDAAHVALRIADDGQGFDLREAAIRARGGQHLGLLSMRERIEQLGGRLQIDSQPGAGTTIDATVPLTEAKG